MSTDEVQRDRTQVKQTSTFCGYLYANLQNVLRYSNCFNRDLVGKKEVIWDTKLQFKPRDFHSSEKKKSLAKLQKGLWNKLQTNGLLSWSKLLHFCQPQRAVPWNHTLCSPLSWGCWARSSAGVGRLVRLYWRKEKGTLSSSMEAERWAGYHAISPGHQVTTMVQQGTAAVP